MSGSKETELLTAVLLYALRCLAEGDHPALRSMNFGPREAEALHGLGLADLYRAARFGAHCLDIQLNRPLFASLLAHLQRERASEALQRALIQADAPLEMMQRFFGLSGREYARLRRFLGVPIVVGRPPEPEEALSRAVWEACKLRLRADAQSPLAPEDYLAIAEECGASLRGVWALVQRWLEYGDLSAPSPARGG